MAEKTTRGRGRAILLGIAVWLAGTEGALAQGELRLDCVIEPNRIAEIGSPVEGVLAEVSVERGDAVKADQSVARLDSRVEYAELAVARARARAESAIREREALSGLSVRSKDRALDLYRRKVISDQVKDETQTDAEVAQAQLLQAKELKRIAALEVWRASEAVERRNIRSPFDGIVVKRSLAPGERVSEQPIMTIAQVDPLRVEAIVPAARFGEIQAGQSVSVTPEPPAQGSYPARVTVVDRIIDPASGTFRVRAELPNPDLRIPSGLRCQMAFTGGTPASSAVPAAPAP